MNMKTLFKILFIALVFSQNAMAQTITKTASNNNPYVGQEFYYTITVDNLTDLSDLNFIEDSFGPELEYLGVDYDPITLYLLNLGYGLGCTSYSDSASTLHYFRLDFNNCSGIASSNYNSFSFKVKVRLNEQACLLKTDYDNKIALHLKSSPSKPVISRVESVTVNKSDPFVLQKTFRNFINGELIYDIRLSSSSGNFYPLDFLSNPRFKDSFTVPSCVTLGSNPSDIKVVLIDDESTMHETPISHNVSRSSANVTLDWNLQGASETSTSILYLVKIKFDSCEDCSQTFSARNEVFFEAKDRCGNSINKSKLFVKDDLMCIDDKVEIPYDGCKVTIKKEVFLDGNDLNLTMQGCTGKYKIKVTNCSSIIKYKNFTLTDILPHELELVGPVVITGNATHTVNNNNTITVSPTAYLLPNESIEVIIPFRVATHLPNFMIDNCASISLYGYDDFNIAYNVSEQDCAPTLVTVPNEVAVVANKILCSDSGNTCGPFSSPDNLPGDTVEYALHFYNYGTVEARSVKVRDALPSHFKIQDLANDVKVYVIKKGGIPNVCDTKTLKDITQEIDKKYSPVTNLLEIDMQKMLLNEFTCESITQYIVKVKVKIDANAPNGVYDNIFVVDYKDPNKSFVDTTISNKVTNIVNVNNLVIGSKTFEAFETDCEAKTKKVTYQITVANLGAFQVYVEINDMLTVPNPGSVTSIGNFELSTNGNPFVPNPISNANASGFHINGMSLDPCEWKTLRYDVVYNTNLLTGNQVIKACNNAKVKVFTKNEKNIIPVITADPSLIKHYFNARTNRDKLDAIDLIKELKRKTKKDKSGIKEYGEIVLGERCVDLSDCLKGSGSGCFSDTSQSFNFEITGMNRNGQISTTLTTSGQKITQIEYLLTDIRQIDTCEDEVRIGTIRGKKYEFIESCFGCSEKVSGIFSTTNTASIGLLTYTVQPTMIGPHREQNKVEFKGLPTAISQDNRVFNFPVGINCNGTYEFTITAIVHFEDCSVCYITDAFDYNASWRFVIPNRDPKVLVGPTRL